MCTWAWKKRCFGHKTFYVCVRAIINVSPPFFVSFSFAGAINTENRAKTGTSGRKLLLCPPPLSSLLKLSGRRLNFLKTGNENKKWKKRKLSHAIYYRIFPRNAARILISCSFFHLFFLSVCSSLIYIMCDVSDIQYYIYQSPDMKRKTQKEFRIQMEVDTHIQIIHTRQ